VIVGTDDTPPSPAKNRPKAPAGWCTAERLTEAALRASVNSSEMSRIGPQFTVAGAVQAWDPLAIGIYGPILDVH
jgi:hypothetical protein